jgi:NADH:ubiquinone oxidoreductase subunit C
MNPEDIKKIITDRFPDKLKDAKIIGFEPSFIADKSILLEFCRFLKETKELSFDLLSCMSGADYPDRFEMIYIFFSFLSSNPFYFSRKKIIPEVF